MRVNLLQHLVDVDSIAFLSLSPSLLLSISGGLCLTGFLLAFLSLIPVPSTHLAPHDFTEVNVRIFVDTSSRLFKW